MKITKFQIATVFALSLSMAIPLAVLAEDQNQPLQNEQQNPDGFRPERRGQNGRPPMPGKLKPQKQSDNQSPQNEDGENMNGQDKNIVKGDGQGMDDNEQNKEQMKICAEAFKNAEQEMKSTMTDAQKQQKQTMREAMKKNRQARFELQTKFMKDMFDAETAFQNAREAAEDSGDKTALKTAQETFYKTKKALQQAQNKALRDLEKEVRSMSGKSQTSTTRPTKEMMQKILTTLPAECQDLMKKFTPKKDSEVKGAFIKAATSVEKQIKTLK